ncbi:amino acid/amide ABC transporter membrane protein 2, HAAT family (TC 3.A.1.4.-) [Alteromonadaceae bacterium Bs31]|nr:amino acid/amide ABC transporter membrane protein 2, HAAT family (TC 3.A.1.4.-) [Alteromonadaceae bacterium Bs31]
MNLLQQTFIYKALQNDIFGRYVLSFVIIIGTVIPLLNVFAPEGSMFDITTFTMTLMGKILCFAILALALDLVWGYCGILSLGHGAFFSLGGYAMGMYLMRQIGDRGVYGNPELPDFMVFLNWDALPWYWYGFDSFGFALLMVFLAPGILAFVFGWMAFRSRVTGVYFSIITQALTFALMQAFFMNKLGFGGNNGLTDFKDILGFNIQSDETRSVLVFTAALVLCITYFVCKYIVSSKFGKVLVSIRDAESRTRFLGYRVEHYKLLVFTFSAIVAGVAGAIYVPLVGAANPSEFSPINSIGIVIWVALGGRGTLYGAIIGALVIGYAKSYFTTSFPDLWLYILGGLFVLTTMYLPEGIAGRLEQLRQKRNGSKNDPSTPAKNAELEVAK